MAGASDGAPAALLLSLSQRALRAEDLAELGFVIANETWHLLHYAQAVVFFPDTFGRCVPSSVSGLVSCADETPYMLWLRRVGTALSGAFEGRAPVRVAATMVDAELREGWEEWWPAAALFVPLAARDGRRLGFVLLLREEEAWSDEALGLAAMLAETWSHCAGAFLARRRSLADRWQRIARHPRRWLLALALVLILPIRISALAPAEVIALQTEAISAPMDGVVSRFALAPNSPVKAGELLFTLDDTTLRNRKLVAEKALAVARANALAAQQKAFDSDKSRAELPSLIAQIKEREAELAYVEDALARVEVRAPQDGIFVYTDSNDWVGKPVVTGERIAQIAQPEALGLLMWLPVGDAINLELGADMRMYLQVAPLSALSAKLVQTSYQAVQSPDGVMAYRIRGRLEDSGDARIGLRGTAKVYGGWRPLVYWILRRPLGTLRQKLGV